MHDFDFDAVTFDHAVYCVECLPDGVKPTSEDVAPIFAGTEWQRPAPTCTVCGDIHSYMNLIHAPNTPPKVRALMEHLEIGADEITVPGDDTGEFDVGSQSYRVLTDEEAVEAATESIKETLWAFSPDFLSRYTNALDGKAAKDAWGKLTSTLCEGANPIVEGLLGPNLDRAIDDAIGEDGRGPFLSPYDSEESEVRVTDKDGNDCTFYIYRVN